MIALNDAVLAACIMAAAILYASVGHAGASAYIAAMALFGVPPETMRPTALVLNILVAILVATRFLRAGLFRWRLLWPFMIAAVPAAYIGGGIILPTHIYRPIVGLVLWFAAWRLLSPSSTAADGPTRDPPIPGAMLVGAGIGLLSGLTGTGGGIFLSPVLILMRWAPPKMASGVAAVFILGNSIAGLAGNIGAVQHLPPQLPLFIGAALVGAALGTILGIKLRAQWVTRALGIVLVIAGAKMIGVY